MLNDTGHLFNMTLNTFPCLIENVHFKQPKINCIWRTKVTNHVVYRQLSSIVSLERSRRSLTLSHANDSVIAPRCPAESRCGLV